MGYAVAYISICPSRGRGGGHEFPAATASQRTAATLSFAPPPEPTMYMWARLYCAFGSPKIVAAYWNNSCARSGSGRTSLLAMPSVAIDADGPQICWKPRLVVSPVRLVLVVVFDQLVEVMVRSSRRHRAARPDHPRTSRRVSSARDPAPPSAAYVRARTDASASPAFKSSIPARSAC